MRGRAGERLTRAVQRDDLSKELCLDRVDDKVAHAGDEVAVAHGGECLPCAASPESTGPVLGLKARGEGRRSEPLQYSSSCSNLWGRSHTMILREGDAGVSEPWLRERERERALTSAIRLC